MTSKPQVTQVTSVICDLKPHDLSQIVQVQDYKRWNRLGWTAAAGRWIVIARGKEVEIGLGRGIGLEKKTVEARTTAEGIVVVGPATTKTAIGVGSLTAKTDTGTYNNKYVASFVS